MNGCHNFDYLILATGNLDNVQYKELKYTSPNYIGNLYREELRVVKLLNSQVGDNLKVGILGTKLGAIDAAIFNCEHLKANKRVANFHVTMASRSGHLPVVRVKEMKGETFRVLNRENIERVIAENQGNVTCELVVDLFNK